MTLLFFLLPPESSVQQPLNLLVLLLLLLLGLVDFELRLRDGLGATLSFEASAIMTVGGSIDVEKCVHLALALVCVVVHLWANSGLLKFAVEAVEVGRRNVLLSRGSARRLLCFALVLGVLDSIVGLGIPVTVDLWVVPTAHTLARRAGTWRAQAARGRGSIAEVFSGVVLY
jgi:hypothetical protein